MNILIIPTKYGLDTNIKNSVDLVQMRNPFRFLPRYFQKCCRKYPCNVCIEMDQVLEVLKPLKQS